MAQGQADGRTDDGIPGYWKHAIRMALALIVVLVILLVFQVLMYVAFFAMRGEGWIFRDMYGEYPVFNAVDDIARGILLLVIAGFCVGGVTWKEALFDRPGLAPDSRNARMLANGLIIGLIAAVGTNLLLSLMGITMYGGKLFVGVDWDLLVRGLQPVLPRLVMYVGLMALLQGYFQRSITGRYGAAAGLLGATSLYLLFTIFPSNIGVLALPLISVQYVLRGAVIAYLYMASRSPYLSIGFMVALELFWDMYNTIFHVYPMLPEQTFLGIAHVYSVALTMIAADVLTLALIWFLYRGLKKTNGDWLKGPGHALKEFLYRLIYN